MSHSRTASTLLLPGLLAFLTLGVLQAVYGPAFPFFQRKFGVNVEGVALIASVHFVGSAVAPLLTGVALTRFSARRVANTGILTLLLGVALIATAQNWNVALLGALVGGLGLGVQSAVLNTAYASLGTRPSNTVNAVFGLGSLLSPLLVMSTAPHSLSVPFVVIGALNLLTLGAVTQWNIPDVPRTPRTAPGQQGHVAVPFALMFSLLLCTYVALEVGFGAWIGTHLRSLNLPNPALIVSAYWAGLMTGRILTGLWGAGFQPRHLVLWAAVTATTTALLATLFPGQAAFAYVLAGVALGPIFPTALVWLSQELPPRLVPFLLVSGSVGGVISPSLIGWLHSQRGPQVIPATLLALALLLVTLALATSRLTRHAQPRRA